MRRSYLRPRKRLVATHLFSTLIAAFALATGACGEDPPRGDAAGNQGDGGPGPSTDDSGSGARPNYDIEGCVVSVLGTDCTSSLPTPHVIELLNAKTGEPVTGFRTTSGAGGKYTFKNVPGEIDVAVHAIGVGPVTESASTYDSIAFHDLDSGENLMRMSTVGTAGLAGMAASFTAKDDKVALTGAVYQVNESGKRVGTIGCAQVYIDDAPHPAVGVDQRYNGVSGIPVTLSKLDHTLAGSGRFYFGNLDKGAHKLKVSMDGGKSFIIERSVFIGKARSEAQSPYKSLLYLVGLDFKGANPMPAGCPREEKP
jgi:hypothetical protein